MNSASAATFAVNLCPTCAGSGEQSAGRRCGSCGGRAAFMRDERGALVWGRPLTESAASLRFALARFYLIRVAAVSVGALLLVAWWLWNTAPQLFSDGMLFFSGTLWFSETAVLLWLGLLFGAYAVTLWMRQGRMVYSTSEIRGLQVPDISLAFSDDALGAVDSALQGAARRGSATAGLGDLLLSLSEIVTVRNLFIRLMMHPDVIANYARLLVKGEQSPGRVRAAPELFSSIFSAFNGAEGAHQMQVRSADLLLACVELLPDLQRRLYEAGVTMEKISGVVSWARSTAQLRDQQVLFRRIARTRPTSGIDRAMTAIATPLLNAYSQDLTIAAQWGYFGSIVGRDKEIDQVLRLLEGGATGVVLVGEAGVGKSAIIEGVAQRMVAETVPVTLQDKRLVLLQVGALLAGATAAEAGERILQMLSEVRQAGTIVLAIGDIHTLVAAREGGEGAMNVAGTLSEVLERSGIPLISTTTPEMYRRVIKGSVLEGMLSTVMVEAMDTQATVSVLQAKVSMVEYKQQVFFSYEALQAIADFARKHLQDAPLPESAIALLKEVAVAVKNKRGAHTLIAADDVAAVVATKTNIPVAAVSDDETEKLLRLEELMHERVIGQDEAVSAVANALRRARAKLSSGKRPIANFLFVGPTGVGKTQLTKTIAEVYFGGEEQMRRFDMSEYQDAQSVYRLIGQPGAQGSGIFTETVREHPFSLVLLDELEKADHRVLNIFLQVMDDGRITDSVGRVVDCTNLIIIATSNAGSQYIQDELNRGSSYETIQEGLLRTQLREHFTPEFLNRFDGVVVFHPLSVEHVLRIAALMVADVARTLEEQYGAKLEVTPEALQNLAEAGFDPQFGARPLRRAIAERLENELSRLLLAEEVPRGARVVFDESGQARVV